MRSKGGMLTPRTTPRSGGRGGRFLSSAVAQAAGRLAEQAARSAVQSAVRSSAQLFSRRSQGGGRRGVSQVSMPFGSGSRPIVRRGGRRMTVKSGKSLRRPVGMTTAGVGPGKSAGFIGQAASTEVKTEYLKKGVVLQQEVASKLQGQEVVFVAHSTAPAAYIRRTIAMLLLRAIMVRHKVQWLDPGAAAVFAGRYTVGDIFSLQYVSTATGVVTTTGSITLVTLSTFEDIINAFIGGLRTIYEVKDRHLIGVEFIAKWDSTTKFRPSMYLNLTGAEIQISSKSALKIQNQSDATIDLGNNQPLNGKFYDSNGNYLKWRNGALYAASAEYFTCEEQGHFELAIDRNSTAFPELREPPPPGAFYDVTSSGKVKLDPGELKTSVLNHVDTVSLARLGKYFSSQMAVATGTPLNGGKCRFIALERMIDADTTPTNMTIAWEIDYKIQAMLNIKNIDFRMAVTGNKVLV